MISHYDAKSRMEKIQECDHDGTVEKRNQIKICNQCSAFMGYDL